MAATVREALNRRGWRNLSEENSVLPSDTVYDLAPGSNGRMLVGTEQGAVILTLSPDTNLPQDWELFTQESGMLPSPQVQETLWLPDETLWMGTRSGLVRYREGAWRIYRAEDLGLAGEQILALEAGSQGELWVGTDTGLTVVTGERSQPQLDTGLKGDFITALAVRPTPGGDQVCAAAPSGLRCLDPSSGQWFTPAGSDFQVRSGGIADLMFDSTGSLWIATLGDGLHRWDGQAWNAYRVSNSMIPSNTIQEIFEAEPGVYWVSAATPTEVGGVLARWDGIEWATYQPRRSGYSGAEALAFALDEFGRLWIGTRTAGIDLYRPPLP